MAGVQGRLLTVLLSPQAPKRSPLGLGGPEPGSDCPEGDQRGPPEREAPPLHGKKEVGVRDGASCQCRRVEFRRGQLSLAAHWHAPEAR